MSTKLWTRLDNEAVELWTKPRAEVRDRLIVHYMPLAQMLATKRAAKNRRVDPDDVQSEAYLALVKSVDDYDPKNERGASFTTFAGWRIRGAACEPERQNDHVNHKVRARDKELRRQIDNGEVDVNTEEGWATSLDLLPKVGHFADEHTGKKRAENSVPDDDEAQGEDGPDLAAEMARWPADIREAVELLLDCGWSVDLFVERVYAADSKVSDELLWKCGPPEKAAKYLRGVLKFIGADSTLCTLGVQAVEAPPQSYEVAL